MTRQKTAHRTKPATLTAQQQAEALDAIRDGALPAEVAKALGVPQRAVDLLPSQDLVEALRMGRRANMAAGKARLREALAARKRD